MTTVTVSAAEREAARLIRELDQIEGRETDPRVEAIANATVRPATVNGSAPVAQSGSGGEAAQGEDQQTTEDEATAPTGAPVAPRLKPGHYRT